MDDCHRPQKRNLSQNQTSPWELHGPLQGEERERGSCVSAKNDERAGGPSRESWEDSCPEPQKPPKQVNRDPARKAERSNVKAEQAPETTHGGDEQRKRQPQMEWTLPQHRKEED